MKITEQVDRPSPRPSWWKVWAARLWDVEYVREGAERFLRVYIDKDGGV